MHLLTFIVNKRNLLQITAFCFFIYILHDVLTFPELGGAFVLFSLFMCFFFSKYSHQGWSHRGGFDWPL